MFLSRTIIATDSAGIKDYVLPGENGLLVPPSDPAAMAAAIESLWNDPATARRLARMAAPSIFSIAPKPARSLHQPFNPTISHKDPAC